MSSYRNLAQPKQETDNSFLKSLKGLNFADWNKKVGLPTKAGRGELPFPYPYEWTVFNELFKIDGSPKDRHVAWLAARGIGKTETSIRILCYLATRNDDLKGSEIMIITGNRASLSYSIISRIKTLMKDANLQDSGMSYVDINGIRVEGYPADPLSGRGKPWVSAIFIDESSWWNPSDTQNVLDMTIGYFSKSNPYCLIASSPSQPGDLMDQIWKQEEDECIWRRVKQDWRYGENLIFTQADLARVRGTSSYARELELRWTTKIGNSFSHSDIARARSQVYDTNPTLGNERTIAIDPAWSSSPIGCVVAELRSGFVTILLAEEKARVTYEDLSEYVYDLWHRYQPVSKLYIDSSQVAFIKTMKQIIGEPADYQEQIKQYRSMKINYQMNMRCEPCYFTIENKRAMMGSLRQQGLLLIHPVQHEILLNAMSQCEDNEGIVANKQGLKGNDVLDALFMITRNYEQ
ncbi:MAG: hypothetical protein WCF23_18440 [Candidatus Nitrosopolaris sp.]